MGLVIVIGTLLGILVLALPQSGETDRERAEKAAEAMNKEQMEDVYGGATPEETLKLFTDALKKGDTELASKYFLIEDREEQKEYLDSVASRGNLYKIWEDIDKGKIKLDGETAYFSVSENGVEVAAMFLGKSPYTGKWKIIEF